MSTLYKLEDVARNDGKNGTRCWIVIRDMVYDVTDYLDQHPGGGELITEFAGKDATKGFDDFGHSGDAVAMLKPLKIGALVEEDRKANRNKVKATNNGTDKNIGQNGIKKQKTCFKIFFCK